MSSYANPAVAVDVALVTIVDGRLAVVMIRRDLDPHRGQWQLPGGFVRIDESLDDAAARVLREKAGLEGVYTEQLYTFGAVDRDQRERVISVAYFALVNLDRLVGEGGAPARDVAFARIEPAEEGEASTGPLTEAPTGTPTLMVDGKPVALAFDHDHIIGLVIERLRGKLAYVPIGYELLPEAFTLLDLQRVHETILGRRLNKDSFRRSMLASGDLKTTGERQTEVGHRPAALYRRVPPNH